MSDMRDAILQMSEEKHISQEMVLETIREFVKAAYKRKFGTDENVVVDFSEDLSELRCSARKVVVEEENYYNEVTEIPLDEARELADDVEVGDSLMIPLDPHTFDRGAVQSAKQRAQQSFKDIQNNYTYSEFKNKEGEVIQCYVNSQNQTGDYHMNVGGGIEGVLPVRNQSPRESFTTGESVKCYLERVENPDQNRNRGGFRGRAKNEVRIILSRTSPELVRKFLELQVPEIYDHQIEIFKIVRQAGIRTKVAVRSNVHDLDPVGATVGLKGNRIQTIMTELEGEKIDVIQWEENPLAYIANALTPAQVTKVLPIDLATKHAVAIVEDNQVGIAIGLSGANVKLANQLCDWIIEVKTQAQFEEMEITQEAREKAEAIFASGDDSFMSEEKESEHLSAEQLGISENETLFSDLAISRELVKKLEFHDVYTAEEFFDLSDEEVAAIGLTEEEKAEIASVIDLEEEQEEQFECPNCGAVLPAGTTHCPSCGVEFEFE